MATFFTLDVTKLPKLHVDKPASRDKDFTLCFERVLFTEGREKVMSLRKTW